MLANFARRAVVTASLIVLAGALMARPASAQIFETRDSSANPMVEVFKSTIYGGLAGLVLGSALALALPHDDNADTVRWSFVGGTFFGFGYGIYDVSTRPQPHAALEHGPRGWALALPEPTLVLAERAPLPMRPGEGDRRDVTVRATLASVGF
jgi:hypothetical protein